MTTILGSAVASGASLLVLLSGAGVAVAAGAGFGAVFGQPGTAGCYRRTYDGPHLASHPAQRTTAIEIGYRPRPAARAEEPGLPVQIYLFTRFKGERAPLSGGHEASCSADGPNVGCSVDGDAGGFSLRPLGGGKVGLDIAERLTIETDDAFVDMRAGDDRSFILTRMPAAACTPIR